MQQEVQERLTEQWKRALREGCDVVIDMTNNTKKARETWLRRFSSEERTTVAVHFAFDANNPDHVNRLITLTNSRAGKPISPNTVTWFLEHYQHPTEEEDFDKIFRFPPSFVQKKMDEVKAVIAKMNDHYLAGKTTKAEDKDAQE